MQSNQKILFTRRSYNKLVANEMMEDFALRYTAKRARKWSSAWIANTALGIVSFLVLEAIGGAITLNYGFLNSAWAILALVAVVFIIGLPISYHAAKYGVDIDLLSRGAGFGYIGSTVASLIYASFTFIFFALEAAIMAMALNILFGLPLAAGYVVSALVVIPLVTHGITTISKFQVWTQPIWIVLQVIPLIYVFNHPDSNFDEWFNFTGNAGESGQQFDLILFGTASAVLLSLVAQIGEQVDFLRFLPPKPSQSKKKAWQWWLALTAAGPGWIIFGAAKLFLGSFLAYLALKQGIAPDLADDPAHMYKVAFGYVIDTPALSILLAAVFVIISQLKINVANAYAGSLAWSNFFSRITHNHPGRVVWMFFNVAIALLLMELGIYQTIESMLQVYSVLVLAWLSSVAADLMINKPLGISPKQIEFKRSHLFDINPVGLGSMIIASFFGFTAHFGWYGEIAQAMGSYIAFILPFITVPLIGLATRGQYYLVDKPTVELPAMVTCHICENTFDHEDITFCPAYGKAICSLCCSLDVRCGDKCRPNATLSAQASQFFRRFLSSATLKKLTTPLAQFLAVTFVLCTISAGILFLIYLQIPSDDPSLQDVIGVTLVKIFFLLMIMIGVVSWLFILARSSNLLALKELRSQAKTLAHEIDAHEQTASQLQDAKEVAENANQAKSRYLTGLSHELRTPLNVLLGYAQLLGQDDTIPTEKRETLQIMKRNGEHLADLIEGLLEISKIEVGRMHLQRDEVRIKPILNQLVDMFRLQAEKKGLAFIYHCSPHLPDYVATDKQRLRQILINLLSNAIKFTRQGQVTFDVSYRNQVAYFKVKDTGFGISKADQALIFKPFERLKNNHTQAIIGTGLGLTISRSLAELMGGEIALKSELNQGSEFTLALMLAKLNNQTTEPEYAKSKVIGYAGKTKTILVVDDAAAQRKLMQDTLSPLKFNVITAENATSAMARIAQTSDGTVDGTLDGKVDCTIDLALLDVMMPEIDGWTLAKQIKMQRPDLPIIMLSANARDRDSNINVEHFHDDYLSKPVNLDNLLGKIGQNLELEFLYQFTAASSDLSSDPSSSNSLSTPCLSKEAELNSNTANAKMIRNAKSAINTTSDTSTQTSLNQTKERAVEKTYYQALLALSEIGYLTGFNQKLAEIELDNVLSINTINSLKHYAQSCNFPQIIRLLNELIEHASEHTNGNKD